MLKHKEEPIPKGDLWERANRFYYKSGFLLGLVVGLLVALIIAIALY